jgi:hypothetical protein
MGVVVVGECGRASSSSLLTPAQGRSLGVVHYVELDPTMWSSFRGGAPPLVGPAEAPRERDCSSRLRTGGSYR